MALISSAPPSTPPQRYSSQQRSAVHCPAMPCSSSSAERSAVFAVLCLALPCCVLCYNFLLVRIWNYCIPSAGFLFLQLKWRCGDTPSWVICATARSRVNDEEIPQSLPRGARMILKDYYSDNRSSFTASTPIVELSSLRRFSLSLMEVWRHTEVGYMGNRTLEGQR